MKKTKTFKIMPGYAGRYEVSTSGELRFSGSNKVPQPLRHTPVAHRMVDGRRVYTVMEPVTQSNVYKKNSVTDVRVVGLTYLDSDKAKAFKLEPGKPVHPDNIHVLDSRGQTNNFGKKKSPNKTSKYRGVCWHKHAKKFVGTVTVNGVRHHVKGNEDEEVVAKRVDELLEHLDPTAHPSRFNLKQPTS